ncbi:hypothetical protein BT96DRAFT_432788 [Gymnopus androsaceus JB14]|uniref:Uncharacterized protein n=1 Tax=Gymnopus androsaceus JB14 TaxID=1447944 RepID=A0A6A4I2N4_9AGAR|nr:hypothetical protein BT96DRAFT_432788 [Gymnopus androsaceus JB14]
MKSRRRSPREERDRRSRSRSRSRSMSWSPSGRVNPSSTSRQRAMGEGVRRSPSFELSSHPTEHVTGTRMSEQSSTLSRLSVRGDFRSKGKRKADSDVPISFELASSRNSRFLERNDSPHSSSAKGKEKADSLDHISSEPASEVEQVTQVPYAVTSSAVPNNKPARILNLRALVQSHVSTDEKVPVTRSAPSLSIEGQGGLSSSLPMSKFGVSVEDAVPQLRIKGQGKPSSSSQLSPPSLLSRLSDTHLGEENVPVSTVLPSNDHRHLDGDEQPRPFPPSSERMSSLTALSGRHDTTGRVRDHRTVSQEIGNIGPIKAGDSDIDHDSRVSSQKYQASASNRDSEEVHPPHVASRFTYEARMNGGKLGSDPRPSSSSVSTVNTRLLQRLEEEKRYLQENNPTPLSPTTLEDSVEIVVGMEDLSSSVSIDSQDMETKLRTRARLRMRLASEKRAFREKSS